MMINQLRVLRIKIAKKNFFFLIWQLIKYFSSKIFSNFFKQKNTLFIKL